MNHPLLAQIAAVRRRAKRLMWISAASRLALVLVALVVVLGGIDYLLRFRDSGVRLIWSLLAYGTGLWFVWRTLGPILKQRLGNLKIAQRVERQYPELAGRLSSSVQFLAQAEDDPTAGSAELRRAVIAETTAETADWNFHAAIDPRPTRRKVYFALSALAAALLLIAFDPSSAGLALTRLANPFTSPAWPRQHELAFTKPITRIAAGQAFEIEVKDLHDKLPDEVLIHFRYLNPEQVVVSEETQKMQLVNRVMVARKENVQRSFLYRAEGGDDQTMPWTALEVLEPPRVEKMKVALTPPEYTGRPVQNSDPRIRALIGTHVALRGTATKPLSSAALKMENGATWPAGISEDGYTFTIPADGTPEFVVKQSGTYWIELQDKNEIVGGRDERWEIRAVPDQPPSVVLEQPTANLFVTPDAVVPLKVLVKDDLAIQSIVLHYTRSDRSDEGEFTLPLFTGPERMKAVLTANSVEESGESRLIEQEWSLAPLELKSGTQVSLSVMAADYKPQSGQSMPRLLTIITPRELENRLTQRQDYILAELARVLKMQQEAREQTTALEIQTKTVGQWSKGDLDRIQGVELSQRQIARTLASPTEGVASLVESLLADLQSNRVQSPDLERRMQGILIEIQRLERGALPTIEGQLTAALKSGQAAGPRDDKESASFPVDPQGAKSLTDAGVNQDEVITSLERLLGDLKQWDSFRQFAREIAQLRQDQKEVAKEVVRLRGETLSQDVRNLTPQQQADLQKLGRRELDLSRRLEKIVQQMDASSKKLHDSEPLAADTIANTVAAARSSAVSNRMNETGRQIERNLLGQAEQQQPRIDQDLEEILDILSDRREQELSRLVAKLRESEEQLRELRHKQEGLKKLANDAQNQSEEQKQETLRRLARQEKELQQEIERFVRRLQRLQADQAARTASKAGGSAGKAGQAGEAGDAGEAGKQAAQAQKDLEDAQEQLTQRRKQAEADLAQEELAGLETALKSLRDRQAKLNEETILFDVQRKTQPRLTRGQLESLQDLARFQDALREDTAATVTKLKSAEAFRLALESAAGSMARAVERLDRRETGAPTQATEGEALSRLELVLAALGEDKDETAPMPGGEDSGDGSQGNKGDAIHNLSELKLLKLMQLDVNAKTRQWREKLARPDHPTLTEDEQRAYLELSKQQGRLAELVLKLTAPSEPDPESNPEKLPGKSKPKDDGLLPMPGEEQP